VKVEPDLGTVRVTRALEVTACGTIINPKASHSQEIGGVVWGIGMALQEATEIDHRYGRIMNPNLQHYHVPVNADVHEVETLFVEEDDTVVNPLGVKGMGELGMVDIPAAIANAVFHATGRRIRELPITLDKLLGELHAVAWRRRKPLGDAMITRRRILAATPQSTFGPPDLSGAA
jgi:xanthine dehydrogenase YagR molybdenum-binding subunit